MQPPEETACEATGNHHLPPHVFCSIADVYDRISFLMSFGLIRSWRRTLARSLTMNAGETWMDLGTGTADLAIALLEASDPTTCLIGIDLVPEMVEQGRWKVWQRGLQGRISLLPGDVEHLDFPDNSVDGCCSAFLMRTLKDPSQSFREMLRVVRLNGQVACLEVSHPPHRIFRSLFHFYFYRCAPLCGALLGQKFKAYQYFPASLKGFPDAPTLKRIMEECGWSDVHFQRLHGGVVTIHRGTKRSDDG